MNRENRGRVLMYRSSIDGVEVTSADTTQTFTRHSHERFGMGIVVLGGQRSASGRGPVEARTGDVITVNPGEVHDGRPLDERGRMWRMLYISPAMMYDVARDLEVWGGASFEIERPVLRDARFAALFERAYSRALEGDVSVAQLAGEEAIFALLADVIGRHTTARLRSQSPVRAHAATHAVGRCRSKSYDSRVCASLWRDAGEFCRCCSLNGSSTKALQFRSRPLPQCVSKLRPIQVDYGSGADGFALDGLRLLHGFHAVVRGRPTH